MLKQNEYSLTDGEALKNYCAASFFPDCFGVQKLDFEKELVKEFGQAKKKLEELRDYELAHKSKLLSLPILSEDEHIMIQEGLIVPPNTQSVGENEIRYGYRKNGETPYHDLVFPSPKYMTFTEFLSYDEQVQVKNWKRDYMLAYKEYAVALDKVFEVLRSLPTLHAHHLVNRWEFEKEYGIYLSRDENVRQFVKDWCYTWCGRKSVFNNNKMIEPGTKYSSEIASFVDKFIKVKKAA